MADYYKDSLKTIIARKLQKKQSTRSLVSWPAQNMLMGRAPTRGSYRSRSVLTRLPSGRLPNLKSTLPKMQIASPSTTRFNFLKGV